MHAYGLNIHIKFMHIHKTEKPSAEVDGFKKICCFILNR
jgi:hypothetical protein